jgi:hypothetical protein
MQNKIIYNHASLIKTNCIQEIKEATKLIEIELEIWNEFALKILILWSLLEVPLTLDWFRVWASIAKVCTIFYSTIRSSKVMATNTLFIGVNK